MEDIVPKIDMGSIAKSARKELVILNAGKSTILFSHKQWYEKNICQSFRFTFIYNEEKY